MKKDHQTHTTQTLDLNGNGSHANNHLREDE